jgi:acetylornithine deacetylase/succinyl-diaminopimelate desuccinylase
VRDDEILELAKALIAIESHSGTPGREAEVAIFARDWLTARGVDARLAEVDGGRANVLAVIGSPGGRRLMLNGHLDTIGGENMAFPAFAPFVRDGRLYGRGACDMKGPVAAMMAAIVDLRDAVLGGEVLFAGVVGEEERSEGTEALIHGAVRADFCIVGEPSDMQVHLGHRGLEWLEVRFHGMAAHSGAQDRGRNAISAAGTFMSLCDRYLRPRLVERRHPFLGASAMNWGFIQGGEQPSVVAAECRIQLDRYWLPGESVASVLGELAEMLETALRLHPGVGGELVRMENSLLTLDHVPTYVEPEHPGVVALAGAIAAESGTAANYDRFPAWTDAALLSGHAGIPSVIYGPGSIKKAHAADEYVPLDELYLAARVYRRACIDFLGQSERK